MADVAATVAECRELLLRLMGAIEELDDNDLEALGETVLAIEPLRDDLTAVRSLAEHRLAEAMDELPEININGATLIRRRANSRKAWDHAGIANDLARQLVQMSVDMETGEILKTPEELIREVVDYAGVSYWKVKALGSIGIVADDYCEVTEGPIKISIQRV